MIALVSIAVLGLVTAVRLHAQNKSGGAMIEAKLVLSTLIQAVPVFILCASRLLMYYLDVIENSWLHHYYTYFFHAVDHAEYISVNISPLIMILMSAQVRKLIKDFLRCKKYSPVVQSNSKSNKRSNKPNA